MYLDRNQQTQFWHLHSWSPCGCNKCIGMITSSPFPILTQSWPNEAQKPLLSAIAYFVEQNFAKFCSKFYSISICKINFHTVLINLKFQIQLIYIELLSQKRNFQGVILIFNFTIIIHRSSCRFHNFDDFKS